MFKEISDAMVGLCSPISGISSLMNIQSDTPSNLIVYLTLKNVTLSDASVQSFKRTKKISFDYFDIYLVLNDKIDKLWVDTTFFDSRLSYIFLFPTIITKDRNIEGNTTVEIIWDFVLSIYSIVLKNDNTCIISSETPSLSIIKLYSLPVLYLDIICRVFRCAEDKQILYSYLSHSSELNLSMSFEQLNVLIDSIENIGIEKLLDYGFIVAADKIFKDDNNNDKSDYKKDDSDGTVNDKE